MGSLETQHLKLVEQIQDSEIFQGKALEMSSNVDQPSLSEQLLQYENYSKNKNK
jgi:hypothetical protein